MRRYQTYPPHTGHMIYLICMRRELYAFVCLFGLRLYVPVNNFSVMSGRSHRFLGITSTFWEVNVSCSRIQHGGLRISCMRIYRLRI